MASFFDLLKEAAGIRTPGLTHYERMQAQAIRKARQRRDRAGADKQPEPEQQTESGKNK